jgi:hypothetical protein
MSPISCYNGSICPFAAVRPWIFAPLFPRHYRDPYTRFRR